ncbi:MAG: PD-(D/E)XK motif protein [Pseudolabrys sp.]
MTISATMTMKIEDLWNSLRHETVDAQRRVDAAHPLDLYADFEQPDRPGLILFCDERPNDVPPLKAIATDRRQRQDGRWSMRIYLEEPRLLPVFAELCRDIVEFTRYNARSALPSGLVLSRIERWRSLMQPQPAGLSGAQLRGLIGELLVLERELLPMLGSDKAVSAWTGPLGTSQDFRLPDGRKLEVKAIDRHADRVQINGLDQLDSGGDPLELVVVRLEDTGIDAEGAVTAARLVEELRARLSQAPAALQTFEMLLRFVGWDDGAETDSSITVRLERIDRYKVDEGFPRLTAATVPAAVAEAAYKIVLPPHVAIP